MQPLACSICSTAFLLTLSVPRLSQALRCFTDLKASQENSRDCGVNSGCVKIYKKSPEFDVYTGEFIPEHRRGPDVQLFRGCFLLPIPDTCFTSSTGLSYCWCSKKE